MTDAAATSTSLLPSAEAEAPRGCPFAGTALPPAPHFTETIPCMPGAISGIASANAPMIYFEGVPFASEAEGVGRLTLTTSRQIGMTPDGKAVANDFVVVAHLRGSLPALKRLRKMIDDLVLHAETPEGMRN